MKERKLKVTYAPGTEYKEKTPRIIMQGKWLKKMGLEDGKHVIVRQTKKKIVVSKNKQ